MSTKTKKILLIIFLALFFYLILFNTNNVYATTYSVSEYYTINTDTDPYSGQAGSTTGTTYYFEYPFSTDGVDYCLIASQYSAGSSTIVYSFIVWDETAEDPYLLFKYSSSVYFMVYACDGDDSNALPCVVYSVAGLSTDSTNPTSSDDWNYYSSGSNPLLFYYSSSSSSKYQVWSSFRLYYSDANIYYHDGSSKGDALFTKSVARQVITTSLLEVLPTTIAQTMTILVPVGLVIFGILFVVYLVRYWIWRAR